MTEQLSKVYQPKEIENSSNEIWISGKCFHAKTDEKSQGLPPYCIVIPPPNVTAALHLGHALNNTLQDILIRFKRMQGFNTLWMPGTDHAGIATQTVVEKRILSEEKKRRTDFKRDEFVARVQAWKDEYEACIIGQLKAMGCSCDWNRTRFTMDEVCAKAVRATFFKLFKDGLIYRGKRLVNWDPATQTVLADDEVEHETIQGFFWYLRYPLVEPVTVPCGTGFQPVGDTVNKRKGAYLPHWTKTGATYAVTFRLADSLPLEITEQWQTEKEKIVNNAKLQNRSLTLHEQQELLRLHSDKIESYLNAGHGQCYLRKPIIAETIANALKYFDGQRYDLIAWVVMPNHVHAVLKPYDAIELSDILHSWKSYTANKANELLGRTGDFWNSEYYDHLIRDEKDFFNQINYVLSNPSKAGLENWPWIGAKTNHHGQDAHATDNHGQDARATIEYVTVATTRPETMLGDTAVAMNPSDPRAKFLIGKKVRLPIVGRIIPIIGDEHVVLPDANSEDEKAKFSTGFLKVTPAHDPDDYAIGERHIKEIATVVMPKGCGKDARNYVFINVMAPDGSISDKHGWEDVGSDAEFLLGMDRFEAREAIVEWFRKEKLLEDVREYTHEVGHSYRSHVPIEPYLSDQWYIAVKKPISSLVAGRSSLAEGFIEGTDIPVNSLAGLALKPLLDGRLKFIPDRYAKTYQNWLENLRDWPISRQLWWGHQIPVWTAEFLSAHVATPEDEYSYDPDFYPNQLKSILESWKLKYEQDFYFANRDFDSRLSTKGIFICGKTFEAQEALDAIYMIKNNLPGENNSYYRNAASIDTLFMNMLQFINRDNDVLDTWFSSALWPFSTLGWPDDTGELKTFYPGNVLCTAREIITLWVSRMVMMGQYCAGDIPFSQVYIHAMIQDGEGRKMSKSLGNGIDPLVAIDSHGADAMRFTLASMTTETQDVRMPVIEMELPDGRKANSSPKFDNGRNFCNKLWNASRFAMMNLEGLDPDAFDKNKLTLADKWILSRLAAVIAETTDCIDNFKFSEPINDLYKFFWNDFCDWYLEWVKPRMQNIEQKPIAQNVLAFVLDQTLRLMHPFIPFITEGIFQKLNELAPIRKLKDLADAPQAKALVIAPWPKKIENLRNSDAEATIGFIQTAIRTIRDLRSKYNIIPSKKMTVSISAPAQISEILNANSDLVCQICNLAKFNTGENVQKPNNAAAAIVEQMQIYLHDAIDKKAELERLNKQKEQTSKALQGIQAKLANENFISKAKPEVVAQTKGKLEELTKQLATIDEHLAQL